LVEEVLQQQFGHGVGPAELVVDASSSAPAPAPPTSAPAPPTSAPAPPTSAPAPPTSAPLLGLGGLVHPSLCQRFKHLCSPRQPLHRVGALQERPSLGGRPTGQRHQPKRESLRARDGGRAIRALNAIAVLGGARRPKGHEARQERVHLPLLMHGHGRVGQGLKSAVVQALSAVLHKMIRDQ
jgi:hypothetical protein